MSNYDLCRYIGIRVETPGEYELRQRFADMRQKAADMEENIKFKTELAKLQIAWYEKYGTKLLDNL